MNTHLPTELYHYIFQELLGPGESAYFIDILDTKREPWNLSQVCREWRTIVLANDVLWAATPWTTGSAVNAPRPRATFNLALAERLRDPVSIARCAIERSGQGGIALDICFRNPIVHSPPAVDCDEIGIAVLQLLAKYSWRWEVLSLSNLCMASFLVMSTPFRSVRGRVPRLRSLSHDFNWAALPLTTVPPSITWFEIAPSLVSLAVATSELSRDGFRLPLAQLIHISCPVNDKGIAYVFSMCPSLASLETRPCYRSRRNNFPTPAGRISSRSITSLKSSDICLATHVRLPRLARLEITGPGLVQGNLIMINDLLNDSKCAHALTSLTLHDIALNDLDSFGSLIGAVAAVKQLFLTFSVVSQAHGVSPALRLLMEGLFRVDVGRTFAWLPKLKSLLVKYNVDAHADDLMWLAEPSFVKAMWSRRRTSAVSIEFPAKDAVLPMDAESMAKLQAWKDDGEIDVSITRIPIFRLQDDIGVVQGCQISLL